MIRYCIIIALFVYGCATPSAIPSASSVKRTAQVNPFLGTAPMLDPLYIGYTPPQNWRVWAGLTYPGSSLPNAMVQLSPITEYGSGAGYEYEDTLIYGFTHTNKGHWNLCNIPVLPLTARAAAEGRFSSRFSHHNEKAAPGYYQVLLSDYNINVELSSTLRTGYHRYTFPASTGKRVLFDLSRANNSVRNWEIDQLDNYTISGFQRVDENKIYFYGKLSSPIDTIILSGDGKSKGNALLNLRDDGQAVVELRIALSFVSTANARQNLEAENTGLNFETIKNRADRTWEALLSRVDVEGGTPKHQWVFYTSLYRSFLWPALRSDVNGDYTDVNGKVVNAGFRYYTTPSLWDTYRNKLVLLGLLAPDVTSDVIRSMKDIGDKRGFLPTFFHGDHAAPFIAGSFARGISWEDVEGTYQLMVKNATVENSSRPHLQEYITKGFISDPHVERPHVETKAKAGVSKTLEYAYDDYSVAQMAVRLGDSATYNRMMQRSQQYKNMFDPGSNFMRGRLKDGSWITPFNPEYPYYEYMYREANAWHLSFFAPHDMAGLIDLYGSAKNFEQKLDTLFTKPWNPKHIARNVSGFVGQYCHGNQPAHEAPYAYHFIGKPWKSQQIIDTLLNHFYALGEHELALCGMDDAGEMSSWYVFAAMGFYPYSPADPEYLLSVPIFDSIRWKLEDGKHFTISKKGAGRRLKSISLSGKPHSGYFVPHHALFSASARMQIETEE